MKLNQYNGTPGRRIRNVDSGLVVIITSVYKEGYIIESLPESKGKLGKLELPFKKCPEWDIVEDPQPKGYGLFGESTLIHHVAETCNVEFMMKDENLLKMYPGKRQTGFTGRCIEMLSPEWRFLGSHINQFGRLESTFEKRK